MHHLLYTVQKSSRNTAIKFIYMKLENRSSGFLIAVEGIDGSGKSSLISIVGNSLEREGYPILTTKEPGGTPLGKTLRTLLMEQTEPLTPKAEFLLFAADRTQHFASTVLPALAENKIVISDRMADSSLIYQGYARGLDTQIIQSVNKWAMWNRKPDITVYMRLTPDEGKHRVSQRNENKTIFERESSAFMHTVYEQFEALYKDRNDVIVADATLSHDMVAHNVTFALLEKLSQYRNTLP